MGYLICFNCTPQCNETGEIICDQRTKISAIQRNESVVRDEFINLRCANSNRQHFIIAENL